MVSRSGVLEVWPLKFGTNLCKARILALEDALQCQEMSLRRLFGHTQLPFSMFGYITPLNLDHYSLKRLGKIIR